MACAVIQPAISELDSKETRDSGLEVKKAGLSRYYSRLQHQWASRLVSGSLFEPTQLEIDRRDRADRLIDRLSALKRERNYFRISAPSASY